MLHTVILVVVGTLAGVALGTLLFVVYIKRLMRCRCKGGAEAASVDPTLADPKCPIHGRHGRGKGDMGW